MLCILTGILFIKIIMISSFLAPIANDKMNECHIYNWHINDFKTNRTYVYMYKIIFCIWICMQFILEYYFGNLSTKTNKNVIDVHKSIPRLLYE